MKERPKENIEEPDMSSHVSKPAPVSANLKAGEDCQVTSHGHFTFSLLGLRESYEIETY